MEKKGALISIFMKLRAEKETSGSEAQTPAQIPIRMIFQESGR